MKHKRGISTMVATIFIIVMITVGITLVGFSVFPLIQRTVSTQTAIPNLVIENQGGYTYWDASSEAFCVQYRRSNSDTNSGTPTGARVSFSIAGNSVQGHLDSSDIPDPGNVRSRCFNLSGYGGSKPERVSLAPLLSLDSTEEAGSSSSEIEGPDVKPGTCSSDCSVLYCVGSGCVNPELDCTNGIDDDGDTFIDCADSDCSAHPFCGPPTTEVDCSNGIDDEGDSWIDCLDSECYADAACAAVQSVASCASFSSGWPLPNGDPNICGESNTPPMTGCSGAITYAAAVSLCESIGTRLCTLAELQADEPKSTGCSYDHRFVWSQTGTGCADGQRNVHRDSSDSEECRDVTSTTEVRCCADLF